MKLTKEQIKWTARDAAEIAEKAILNGDIDMPAEFHNEKKRCLGIDLINGKEPYEGDKEEIDPEAYYEMEVPVFVAMNVERRARKALEENGLEGLSEFMKSIGLKIKF